jgi:hypothetical protein
MRRFFQTRLFQQVLVPASGGDFNLALSDGGTLPVSTQTAGGGGDGVTAVTGTAPVTSTGGGTPAIGITPSAPANTLAPGANGQAVLTVAGAAVWSNLPATGPGSSGYVIWRPGVASAGQAVRTAPELIAAMANGAVTIYVDSSHAAATLGDGGDGGPAGFALARTDGGVVSLVAWNGVSNGGVGEDLLTVADTATIDNLANVSGGLHVHLVCLTAPALTYSRGDMILELEHCIVDNAVTSTVPAFTVPGGGTQLQIFQYLNALVEGASTTAPMFTGGTHGFLEVNALNGSFATALSYGCAGGSGGGTLQYNYDASVPPQDWTFLTGVYSVFIFDSDQAMAYGAGTAFPVNSTAIPLQVGQPFFRTDLNQEYRWNGTIWVASSTGPGADVSITALAAAAYTTAFLQALAVTPATFPGTPIAAFNVTPTQTGLLELSGEVLVNPTSAEIPAYEVVIIAGSSSGGVAGGVNTLLGDTANPLTVPGGGQTHIGRFSNLGAASIAQTSSTLACQGQVAVGTAVTVVVYASSQSGANAWTFSANLRVYERPLN